MQLQLLSMAAAALLVAADASELAGVAAGRQPLGTVEIDPDLHGVMPPPTRSPQG